MIETATFRKNKIELEDYDYERDINNRLLMAGLSPQDVEVLEEILFSSLTIPVSNLASNLDIEPHLLFPILEKLEKTGLFSIKKDEIHVDKEMRKYYEFQISKFDPDFQPGMDYLQGLLKKVPIQVLPSWYAIPRSSNNIFDSIIEKYLLTPQIYQRYLLDIPFADPIQKEIMDAVFDSENLEVSTKTLKDKFSLESKALQEHLLFLEFSLICCVSYRAVGNRFEEVVTPFAEWRNYLLHIRNTRPQPSEGKVKRLKKSDFAFIEDMAAILKAAPFSISETDEGLYSASEFSSANFHHLVTKLMRLKFAEIEKGKLAATERGTEWLSHTLEEQAIAVFRHPLNHIEREDFSSELLTDKAMREGEKSILPALDGQFYTFEDLYQSLMIPLKETQAISLQKVGRNWRYRLPQYNDEELDFFKAIISEWFFEVGITALATIDGKEGFCVTSFGQQIFGDE